MTDSEFKALRPGDKVSLSGKQIAFDAVVTGSHTTLTRRVTMKRKSGSQWSKIGPIVVAVIILLLALASPAFAQGGDTLGVGLSLGAICLIVIPIVAVYVWMILWIRKDAAQRGQSGCMPIALVLIFGPIGLVIWLLMRPKDQV